MSPKEIVKPVYGRMLVLVKPDAMKAGHTGDIMSRVEKHGRIVGLRVLRFDKKLAREFYAEHAEKSWFQSLLKFMTSGPIIAIVVEGEDIVDNVRHLIGSTDPTKAKSGTLRKKYGTSTASNAVHGSDSDEAAEREIALIFQEEELVT